MFPNIRTLDWCMALFNTTNDEIFAYLPLFMGPNTKRLSIFSRGLSFSSFSLLKSLPRAFPGITHFTFNFPLVGDIMSISHIDYAQWGLQSLRTSEVLPRHVIMGLSNTSLRALTAMIGGSDWDNLSETAELGGFACMEELCITSISMKACTSLMGIMAMSPLSTLDVTIIEIAIPQSSNFAKFIRVISTHGSLTTLRFKHRSGMVARSLVVNEHTLTPLLLLNNLVYVHINVAAIGFGNRMVRKMANAWPKLVSLDLCEGGWAGESQITLAGLLPLIKLPALRELSIPINASVVDYTLGALPVDTPSTNLLQLRLHDSIIEDPFAVAAFLSDLFPNLITINAWETDVIASIAISQEAKQQYAARWKEVARLVPLLVKVRRQERRRRSQLIISGMTDVELYRYVRARCMPQLKVSARVIISTDTALTIGAL